MADENVIKKIVREVIKGELKPFDSKLAGIDNKFVGIDNKFVGIDNKLVTIDNRLDGIDNKFLSFKNEIISAVEKANEKLLEQVVKIKDETITSNDKIAGEIKTMREEQVMLNGRTAKINKIEDEVESLKQIHPNGQHQYVT